MVAADECLLLYALAIDAGEGAIVEIGTFRGRSTVALALGSMRGAGLQVYAVDPHEEFTGVLGATFGPEDRIAFDRNIRRAGVASVVQPVESRSADAARDWSQPVSLLWIDGDHSYEAVRQDVDDWSPHLTGRCIVALHDSTRHGVGPDRAVTEMLETGEFVRAEVVGSTTVLQRRPCTS